MKRLKYQSPRGYVWPETMSGAGVMKAEALHREIAKRERDRRTSQEADADAASGNGQGNSPASKAGEPSPSPPEAALKPRATGRAPGASHFAGDDA